MIEKNLLSRNGCLLDALMAISSAPGHVVFIVDDTKELLDVLNAERIREMLAAGHSIDEPLSLFIGNHCPSVDEKGVIDGDEGRFACLPVVDSGRRVVGCYKTKTHKAIPLTEPLLGIKEFGYLAEACLSGWISSGGHYIGRFEQSFADYCGAKHGVAVANGTVALHLALLALDIGPGDEVIVPDLTFAATINAVLYTGATPVIVDIDDSWCIDPDAVRAAITSRTRAVIPVHIYGQACDMDALMAMAREHGLAVIEDCAEAHGAECSGRRVGSIGDIGCFSFFGNKIITTGEGGMCTTSFPELETKMRILRDHGMSRTEKYKHAVIGYNYRMTNLQAAIGVAQVEKIEQILMERSSIETTYRYQLSDFVELVFQQDFSNRKRVVWLMSLLVPEQQRDSLIDSLKMRNIDSRPFFCPLSRMDLYRGYAHNCRYSVEVANRGINLPTFPKVDVLAVTNAFKACIKPTGRAAIPLN